MGEATDKVRSVNELDDVTVSQPSATSAAADGNDEAVDGGQQAAEIRSGIEQTRADLSDTIEALQEKLDPARIAEQVKGQIREKAAEAYDTAKDAVKEATLGKAEKIMSNVSDTVTNVTERAGTAMKDTGSSVVQYIRDNPVPFAFLGIGAGMLAWSTRRKETPRYDSGAGFQTGAYGRSGRNDWDTGEPSLTDRATSAVSSAATSVRDAASSAADATRQQFSHVSDQARQGVRATGDRFKSTLQDNPMALGVAALAAGAIVGLTLPTTRVENEYMGEARDRLMGQAKSIAHDAAEKVQRVAGEAGRTLKDAAQKEGLTVGGSEG